MSVQTIVNDVKGRVEPIVTKGQEVVGVSVEALKQANSLVVSGVQSLLETQLAAGKDLLASAQTSFEKAKADGLKAVAAKPIVYLPEGRERVLSAYNDSVTVVSKTGEKLAKVFKDGFDSVSLKLGVTKARPAHKAAKKSAKKAGARKAAVKKAAPAADVEA